MQAPTVLRPLCWGLLVAGWRRCPEEGSEAVWQDGATRLAPTEHRLFHFANQSRESRGKADIQRLTLPPLHGPLSGLE
jgi:hypothetical protein